MEHLLLHPRGRAVGGYHHQGESQPLFRREREHAPDRTPGFRSFRLHQVRWQELQQHGRLYLQRSLAQGPDSVPERRVRLLQQQAEHPGEELPALRLRDRHHRFLDAGP